MKIHEIQISAEHKKQLAKEFGKTVQAVRMSLRYIFNSNDARAIRRRAKELLQEEINKININP